MYNGAAGSADGKELAGSLNSLQPLRCNLEGWREVVDDIACALANMIESFDGVFV